jgi:hypothetical protein
LHPQRRTVFAGNVIFPAAVLDDLMKVISEWWKTIKDHEGLLQTLCRDSASHVSDKYDLVKDSAEQLKTPFQDCIMLTMFYNGSEEEGRKNFQQFYDLSEWGNEDADAAINSCDQNPSLTGHAKSLSNH